MQTHAAFARGHLIWDLIMLWVRAVDCQKKDIEAAFFYPNSFHLLLLGPSALMILILDLMVCTLEFGCFTWLWIPFGSLSNMALGLTCLAAEADLQIYCDKVSPNHSNSMYYGLSVAIPGTW
jgi:hypothetical protein